MASIPYDLYPSYTKHHELREVYTTLTLSEVAAGWHKHHKTVLLAIQTDRLTARKTGKVYLISYASVIRLWGLPVEGEVHYQPED